MIKSVMGKLDEYMLSEVCEEITTSDRVTVYGFYTVTFGIGIILAANLYF